MEYWSTCQRSTRKQWTRKQQAAKSRLKMTHFFHGNQKRHRRYLLCPLDFQDFRGKINFNFSLQVRLVAWIKCFSMMNLACSSDSYWSVICDCWINDWFVAKLVSLRLLFLYNFGNHHLLVSEPKSCSPGFCITLRSHFRRLLQAGMYSAPRRGGPFTN